MYSNGTKRVRFALPLRVDSSRMQITSSEVKPPRYALRFVPFFAWKTGYCFLIIAISELYENYVVFVFLMTIFILSAEDATLLRSQKRCAQSLAYPMATPLVFTVGDKTLCFGQNDGPASMHPIL